MTAVRRFNELRLWFCWQTNGKRRADLHLNQQLEPNMKSLKYLLSIAAVMDVLTFSAKAGDRVLV
jgi:hypothetical protein